MHQVGQLLYFNILYSLIQINLLRQEILFSTQI